MRNELIALAVFVFSYVLISARRLPFLRLHRPAAALVGAVLMVLVTDMTVDEAYAEISWDTVSLLLGTMLIVAYLRRARFFEWVAYHVLAASSSPRTLVWLLVIVSGLLSALFVNDTICVMFTPIVLLVVARSGLAPAPFLLALATGSNVGSVLTFTGNPQNMLVGTHLVHYPGWSYASFTLRMLPIGLLGLVVCAATICRVYRTELAARTLGPVPFRTPTLRRPLILKCTVVVAAVLAAFLAFPTKLAFAAIAGAAALTAWSRRKPERIYAKVDWPLLLFFAALFVIVGGVRRAGVVDDMRRLAGPYVAGGPAREVGLFSVAAVICSNLFSNVPYVLVAGTWVEAFDRPDVGWFTLAMASTFAGNLTIFGSVANMIVLELSRDRVHVGFWEYCRVGIPITLATTAIGIAFAWLYHMRV
jgi:Na+/H+ antiporter NhaD/arsenite permease-like protein